MTTLFAALGCSAEATTGEEATGKTEDELTFTPLPPLPPGPVTTFPKLVSLSQQSGPPGTQVIINGAYLTKWGAMTVRYGGQVLPHTIIPNTQNVLVTVPRLGGSRPFTATFANFPGTIQSPNFNCIIPATGSLEVINNAQWRATSIRLDGNEALAPSILPSTNRTTFNNIPNGNHTIVVVLGTAAVPDMFNQSGTFTINGGLTSSIATSAYTLADIVTNFQPSRTFQLLPSLVDDIRYTINGNGTWSWFQNGAVFPGPGFATWMTTTSWPADAESIRFQFNDGTPAVYNVYTGELTANGSEHYYP